MAAAAAATSAASDDGCLDREFVDACICCGYITMEEEAGVGWGSGEICPLCLFEDSAIAVKNAEQRRGNNQLSLVAARAQFQLMLEQHADIVFARMKELRISPEGRKIWPQ